MKIYNSLREFEREYDQTPNRCRLVRIGNLRANDLGRGSFVEEGEGELTASLFSMRNTGIMLAIYDQNLYEADGRKVKDIVLKADEKVKQLGSYRLTSENIQRHPLEIICRREE